jgi:leucyl-tRNA synthetase
MPATTSAPEGDVPPHRYTAALARQIEGRWQDYWEEHGTYAAPNPAGPLADPEAVAGRPKLFVLDMFPYPSGAGLHVGHPLGFIGTDVFSRYKRMTGFNVLHAMGFDAFGLPAEQYAVETGTHPRSTTEANIERYRAQIRQLGLGHDERRGVSTTDVPFYRWTQWIFLQIFNSWYDTALGRARPIAELEQEFADGRRPTPSGQPWASLGAQERRAAVDAHRLAYVSEAPVNWCPGLGTVLANEEVTADGRSDRGNFPVFRKKMKQWMMRITAYADRLIDDLDRLDWPEPIRLMQRNWIGRSAGAFVDFASAAGPIRVFTTRPDTLFGATFMVLAPEHPLVDALTTDAHRDAVDAYRRAAAAKSDLARQEEKEKTGVFTGGTATNPLTGEAIPVWIADYVLMGYGTGAIMAVPCGDQRDFEFARAFGLSIPAIQRPADRWFADRGIEPSLDTATWPEAYVGDAPYVNSSNGDLDLNGDRTVAEATAMTNAWLEAKGLGEATVTYKLRDWLFSRQRYWGEPFPIVWDEHGPIAVHESMLPVLLPDLDDFAPQRLDPDDDVTEPLTPLARATDWVDVELDLGDGPRSYRRELNVMPQWAGSCWYELRYLDPTNESAFVDPEVERYWMGKDPSRPGDPGGVDLYVGGVEHAVLHLLYARFWHKVLYDLGHLSSEEPFRRLFNQGYIQAYAYTDERGVYVDAAAVEERDGGFFFEGRPVRREYGKMGKSLKNVVTPDEMCASYGADTFRLYEMSMGPLDASRPWSTRDIVGMQRFLQRLWRNVVDEDTGAVRVTEAAPPSDLVRQLHRTVAGVRDDMEHLRFNTAIAKLIELNNALTSVVSAGGSAPRQVAEPLTQMLAPLAPHLAEELWQRLGHEGSIVHTAFPAADPALLTDDTVEVPVQINGKVRSRVIVPAGADVAALEAAALVDPKVVEALGGGAPRKVVAVPGRMVNVVV